MKIIESHYVSIGQAAKIIGLSIPTLRRYEKSGLLNVDFRTFGNHRRYHVESLKKAFSKNNQATKTICYARVSSAGQKDDLLVQEQKLIDYCKNKKFDDVEIIKEVGSGLNYNKKGFKKLIQLIIQQKIKRLVINYNDRLLRFGHEIVFHLCSFYGVEVIVLEHTDKDFYLQLTEDIVSLMNVFCGKLYGKRSHSNKKAKQQDCI